MKLLHTTLAGLEGLGNETGWRIGHLSVIGGPSALLECLGEEWPGRLGHELRLGLSHLRMGLVAAHERDEREAWIVHEVFLQHAMLLVPLLALCDRPVFVIVHGNRPGGRGLRMKRLGQVLLDRFFASGRGVAVYLEVPPDENEEKADGREPGCRVIPMPAVPDLTPRLRPGERFLPGERIRVGVVGLRREGKPVADLLARLKALLPVNCPGHELVVGVPFQQGLEGLPSQGVTLVDTTDPAAYGRTLRSCHVLAVDFDPDDYAKRPSAIVNDALSAGCRVVTRRLRAIARQVEWPVRAGVLFDDVSGLEGALVKALAAVRSEGQDAHWRWREGRSAAVIASALGLDRKHPAGVVLGAAHGAAAKGWRSGQRDGWAGGG